MPSILDILGNKQMSTPRMGTQGMSIPSISNNQMYAQQYPKASGAALLPPDISGLIGGQEAYVDDLDLGNDPSVISRKIQEYLGAVPQNQSGIVEDILAGRSKPNLNDWADSVAQTAVTGKPIGADSFSDQRMQTALKALETMQQSEFERQKFSEMQRHNLATEGLTAQRISASYPTGGTRKLSATEQKELFDLQDNMGAAQNVLSSLDHALAINDQAISGFGAESRNALARNLQGSALGRGAARILPWVSGDQESVNATTDLQTTVTEQALNNLKAIFGGMPTEGERKILLEMQGSLSKSAPERKIIFERAKALAARRIQQNEARAGQILTGQYSAQVPDYGANVNDISDAIDSQQITEPLAGWTVEEQ